MIVAGLIGMPRARRLINEFQLKDLSPSVQGYQRAVSLRVSPRQFLDEMRLLIAECFTLVWTDDGTGDTDLTCRVRVMVDEGDLEIRVLSDQTGTYIAVRDASLLSPLIPVHTRTAQVLAGLVKWAAGHGLVVADFGPLSRPERLRKDLGNWLPRDDGWRTKPPRRWHAPARDWSLRSPLNRRILIAGVVTLAIYAVLVWIDRTRFPIPRGVQLLPIYALLAYTLGQVVRRDERAR